MNGRPFDKEPKDLTVIALSVDTLNELNRGLMLETCQLLPYAASANDVPSERRALVGLVKMEYMLTQSMTFKPWRKFDSIQSSAYSLAVQYKASMMETLAYSVRSHSTTF